MQQDLPWEEQEAEAAPRQPEVSQQERRARPLFFIDIAVPRDVDPAVNGCQSYEAYVPPGRAPSVNQTIAAAMGIPKGGSMGVAK